MRRKRVKREEGAGAEAFSPLDDRKKEGRRGGETLAFVTAGDAEQQSSSFFGNSLGSELR